MRDRRGQSGISGYRAAVSLSHGQEDGKGGNGAERRTGTIFAGLRADIVLRIAT